MTTYWFCLECVAGSTENATSTLAQQHTQRTGHATMGTTVRATWMAKMRVSADKRGGAE